MNLAFHVTIVASIFTLTWHPATLNQAKACSDYLLDPVSAYSKLSITATKITQKEKKLIGKIIRYNPLKLFKMDTSHLYHLYAAVSELRREGDLKELEKHGISQNDLKGLQLDLIEIANLRKSNSDTAKTLLVGFLEGSMRQVSKQEEGLFDILLGLEVRRVAQSIYEKLQQDLRFQEKVNRQRGFQDSPDTFSASTSYRSFYEMLRELDVSAGDRVVDLGFGLGRLGIVVGLMFSGVQFIGYEIVPDRVDMANKVKHSLGLNSQIQFIEANLGSPEFRLPEAEYYFAYDPVDEVTGLHLSKELHGRALAHSLKVVVRGALKGFFETGKRYPDENIFAPPQQLSASGFVVFESR